MTRFFKRLLFCLLLLWGAVAAVVALAQFRARKHLANAAHDKPSRAESGAEA